MPFNPTVRFSDGTVHTYSGVPDGTGPQDVASQAAKDFPGKKIVSMDGGSRAATETPAPSPTPTPAPAPEEKPRTWGETLSMRLGDVVHALGDVSQFASQAMNPEQMVTNAMMRGLSGGSAPTSGDLVQSITDKAASHFVQPVTTGEKFASAATRGAAAALIPGIGEEALAARAAGAAPAAASIASRLLPAADRLATQGVAGATSGTVGALPEILDPNAPWWEKAAASVGALATGIAVPTAAEAAGRAAGKIASHTIGEGLGPAAKILKGAAGDEAAQSQAISNIANAPTPVTGVNPTLAEVAGNRGLTGLQRSVPSDDIQARMQDNAQARTAAALTQLGTGDVGSVGTLGQTIKTGLSNVLIAARNKIGGLVDQATSGRDIRGKVAEAYDAAKADSAEAYSHPVLQNGISVKTDPQSLINQIQRVGQKWYGDLRGDAPAEANRVISGLLDTLGEGNLNTRTVTNIDQRLADLAGNARVSGEAEKAAAMEDLRSSINKTVAPDLPNQYIRRLNDAKAVRAYQGQTFEQGPVGDTFGTGKYNEPNVRDTALPEQLVQKGGAGGDMADQLTQAVGPNASEQAMREQLRRMVDTGAVKDFKNADYDQLAQRFPALQNDINDIRQAASNVKDFKGSQLDKVSAPGADVQTRVTSLLGKKNAEGFNELRDSVLASGDQNAIDGLRAGLADHISTIGESGATIDEQGNVVPGNKSTAIKNILAKTEGTTLLSDDQRNALGRIQKELETQEFLRTGGTPKDTTSKLGTVPAETGFTSRLIHFAAEHFSNQGKVDALVQRSILDPQFASSLLQRATPNRMAAVVRAARNATMGAYIANNQNQKYPGLTGSVTDTGDYSTPKGP
jgi:hypothetical protein